MANESQPGILKVIEEVYDAVDNDRVAEAVSKCMRIARHLRDHLNIAVFYRECTPRKPNFSDVLLEDFAELKKDAFKYVFDQSGEIWLRNHTLNEAFLKGDNGEERNVFALSIRDVELDIEQSTAAIGDLQAPRGMSEYDTASVWHQTRSDVALLRARIKGANEVKQNVASYCLNYAVGIERRSQNQRNAQAFHDAVFTRVNNYFAAHSQDVYKKLQKACQLLEGEDAENRSLVLTSVRRCISAVSDHFYPASTDPVECSDGKERVLGQEQYMNRLEEHINRTMKTSASRDLLKKECQLLVAYVKRLNDLASKGVHSDVAGREAQQGLLGVYLFSYNLINFSEKAE